MSKDVQINYRDNRTKLEKLKEADTLRRTAAYARGKALPWDEKAKIYA